jgi:hypothetical protein
MVEYGLFDVGYTFFNLDGTQSLGLLTQTAGWMQIEQTPESWWAICSVSLQEYPISPIPSTHWVSNLACTRVPGLKHALGSPGALVDRVTI